MIACPKCLVLHATEATKCAVCSTRLGAPQPSSLTVHATMPTCPVCQGSMRGLHGRTRFCSPACKHKANYLYRKDPAAYAAYGPRYEHKELKARHAAVRDAIASGLITKNTKRGKFEIPKVNNPVDVVWLLIDADTPAIEANQCTPAFVELIQSTLGEDTPLAYAKWRSVQPWAERSKLAETLSALTGTVCYTATPQSAPAPAEEPSAPIGIACICSLCDARFQSPFQTDICRNCRD